MDELSCSQATLYRLVASLRDELGAPLEQDPENKGYYYHNQPGIRRFELPGIWLSAEELQALIAAKDVLSNVQPGLLEDELGSLQNRISGLLEQKGIDSKTQSERVRIIHQASRLVPGDIYRLALTALTQRKRIRAAYHSRGKDQHSEREISPQRLTSYRNNWYLDAWCHLRQGLRSFALERLHQIETLEQVADDIDPIVLNQHFASAYGIFSGPAPHVAHLRFSPKMARWVSEELWHSKQTGQWTNQGYYELKLPFGQTQELLMDIQRFGPEVEVISPEFLKNAVREQLEQTLTYY